MNSKYLILTIFSETVNRAINLFVSLILAKNLTVDAFGLMTIFVSTISMGQTMIDFGSQNFAVRSLLQNKNYIQYKIILNAFKYRLLGLVGWLLFSTIYVYFLDNSINKYYFAIWGIIYFFCTDWIFKGTGKNAKQSIIFAISNGLFLGLLMVVLYFRKDIDINDSILLSKTFPLLMGVIILSFILLKNNHFSRQIRLVKSFVNNYKFNKNYFFENLYFTSGGFLARAYNSIGIIVLGTFLSASILGSISYAYIFFSIFSMGRGIIISSFFPIICDMNLHSAKKYIVKSNGIIFLLFVFIIFIISPFYKEIIALIVPENMLLTDLINNNFVLCLVLIGVNCISFFNIAFIQSFYGGKIFNFLMLAATLIMLFSILVMSFTNFLEYSLFISLIITEFILVGVTNYLIWKKK